jgi:protein-S-isoprenylcysteine O-methyltransferase Ste14
MKKLTMRAYVSLLVLFVVIALLLFGSAGTLDYWQAWTFLVVYFAASFAITLYLVKKDPELLRRRMRGGPFAEKQMTQKIIMSLTSLGFIGLIVVPALDHRFGWSQLPPSIVLAGVVLVALGILAI